MAQCDNISGSLQKTCAHYVCVVSAHLLSTGMCVCICAYIISQCTYGGACLIFCVYLWAYLNQLSIQSPILLSQNMPQIAIAFANCVLPNSFGDFLDLTYFRQTGKIFCLFQPLPQSSLKKQLWILTTSSTKIKCPWCRNPNMSLKKMGGEFIFGREASWKTD